MSELNAPGTYDGKSISELSDRRLALARNDVAAAIARIEAATQKTREDKAEYLARMQALLPEIDAEIARRGA